MLLLLLLLLSLEFNWKSLVGKFDDDASELELDEEAEGCLLLGNVNGLFEPVAVVDALLLLLLLLSLVDDNPYNRSKTG